VESYAASSDQRRFIIVHPADTSERNEYDGRVNRAGSADFERPHRTSSQSRHPAVYNPDCTVRSPSGRQERERQALSMLGSRIFA
jgi:hypothetical protein